MTLRRWNIVPMGTCPRHWGSGQLPARKTVTGQWWALWYQSLQDRSFPKDHTPGKWNLSSMKECEWWNQCSRQFLIIYVHGWRHKGGGPNGQRRSIGKDGCSKCLLNNPSPSRGQMASGYAWSLCGYLSPIWLGACPHHLYCCSRCPGVDCEGPRGEDALTLPGWFYHSGGPATGECQASMTCLSQTCEQLGISSQVWRSI